MMRPALPLLAVLCLALACESGSEEAAIPDTLALTLVSGDHQTGFVGEEAAELELAVVDGEGNPVRGATVTFAVLDEPARPDVGIDTAAPVLAAPEAVSDGDGRVRIGMNFGATPGGARVEARLVEGRVLPVTFHVQVYPALADAERGLCVLSFNDFHMHFEPWGDPRRPVGGLARLAGLIRTIRAENDAAGIETVVFNAGDDFENTMYQDTPGAYEALLETWDRIGVDATQIGNHEVHFGVPFLVDRILSVADGFAAHDKGHPMVLTWGNVDPTTMIEDLAERYAPLFEIDFDDPDDERLFQQTAVINKGDLKVGVIGVTTDEAIFTQVAGNPGILEWLGGASPDAQGMRFLDPTPLIGSTYIEEAIDTLDAAGVDVIVVNSHAGLGFGDRVNIPAGKDEFIAADGVGVLNGRPIDLVVSGHSHVQLSHAIFVENPAGGRTGIVQGLEGGLFLTRSDLVVDRESDALRWVDSRLLQVDDRAPEDEETRAVVDELAARVDEAFPGRNDALVQSASYLSSREGTFSGLGRVINAAFLQTMTGLVDDVVTFVVPSTYRTDVYPGPVDPDLVYQVLSMHKLDAEGTNPDTLAYVTVQPGRYNMSLLGMPGTHASAVTPMQYLLEMVHSMKGDVFPLLQTVVDAVPMDVVQLGGVSYVYDATAPAFHRIDEASIRIHGAPLDDTRTYRIAAAHSIVTTLGRAAAKLFSGVDPDSGESMGNAVLVDETTGEPFTDTGVALWAAMVDYLSASFRPDTVLPEDLVTMAGEPARSIQPDLTVNPADVRLTPAEAAPGETVSVEITVRNLGEVAVDEARVALHYESTPWDRADDPDGFAAMQGLPGDDDGSRLLVDGTTTAVGAYPETATVSFSWTLPTDLPPGAYPLEVHISDVATSVIDPNTEAPYEEFDTFNNAGRQYGAELLVR